MGWEEFQTDAGNAWREVIDFGLWLNIHPSPQDLVKAAILSALVALILLVVGDVYRGEIQNRLYRIRLIPHPRAGAPRRTETGEVSVRRRMLREKDITLQLPQSTVPLTLNSVFSNFVIHLRYRDCRGRLKSRKLYSYRTRLRVRVAAFSANSANIRHGDHDYRPDEDERLVNEDSPAIVALAASRVDFLYEGLIDPFKAKLESKLRRLRESRLLRFFSGIKEAQLCEPEYVGLCAKFHFPIDPVFLLYKHPDTNVKTTAWLTVLTSAFALVSQLAYSSPQADEVAARATRDRAELASAASRAQPVRLPH